jgi:outer membrane protein OmpA-like peptidoglycan-associated protein
MTHTRLFMIAAGAIVVAGLTTVPRRADAQLLGAIKKQAADKVKQKKDDQDKKVLDATGKAVDSSLTKTGRAEDKVVERAGSIADTAMNKTERGVSGAAHSLTGKGGASEDARIRTQLDSGRLVLPALGFAAGGSEPNGAGAAQLARVAKAMLATSATYLIESHVADGSDAAANQALSEKRGAAVKAKLVADGVPAGRLFVMSYGSQRPAANGASSRIEIAKMQ